jgi:DNA-directed RNA polymerase subunit D
MATISVVARKGRERLWVKLAETTPAFANALRRAVLAHLPSFAIDEVHVYENTSPLYNEYVAHRVGLVPLTWEEGVADDAKIAFSLESEGPAMVTSGDLKSTDEVIKVHNPKLPIVKLGQGQKLRLDGFAIKGMGRTHAKFQCAHASYTYWTDLKSDKKRAAVDAVKRLLPRADVDEDLALTNPHEVDVLSVADQLEEAGVAVKPREDAFLFQVESYNNIPAGQQLARAVKTLARKCEELEDFKI